MEPLGLIVFVAQVAPRSKALTVVYSIYHCQTRPLLGKKKKIYIYIFFFRKLTHHFLENIGVFQEVQVRKSQEHQLWTGQPSVTGGFLAYGN